MKKYPLFILLLFLTISNSFAQITFQKTYGGYKDEKMTGLAMTSDGGYAMAGGTASFGDTTGDIYLIKTDATGKLLWSKVYKGAPNSNCSSFCDYSNAIIETADHGLMLVGQTYSFGAGGMDAFLIKTDSAGNIQWSKAYGGPQDDFFLNCRQTFDGGYIAIGATQSFGAGDWDILIVRLNASGDTLWTRILGGALFDWGTDVIQTSDSNFVFTARTYSYSDGYPDASLVKMNRSGDTLWTRAFGGPGEEEAESVKQTYDGGYIVPGSTNSFSSSYDVYLNRFDSTGHLMWSKTYGGSMTDASYQVLIMSDSGYALLGFTNSFNPVFRGDDSSNTYIIRTDANGDTLWTREYGGDLQDESYGFVKTADDGLVSSGYTSSFGTTGTDAYLIRTNAKGNSGCYDRPTNPVVSSPNTIVGRAPYHINSGISVVSAPFAELNPSTFSNVLCYFVGVVEQDDPQGDLIIYPDPVGSELRIKNTSSTLQKIDIYNVLGQKTSPPTPFQRRGEEAVIDVSKLAAGVYFVHLSNETSSRVGKFVKAQ